MPSAQVLQQHKNFVFIPHGQSTGSGRRRFKSGDRIDIEALLQEEESRKERRRERNRVSATRCREKIKGLIEHLESHHSQLSDQNAELLNAVQVLELENKLLKEQLAHLNMLTTAVGRPITSSFPFNAEAPSSSTASEAITYNHASAD